MNGNNFCFSLSFSYENSSDCDWLERPVFLNQSGDWLGRLSSK